MVHAWILNLDADDELARPNASTSRAMHARITAIASGIPRLLPPGDVLLTGDAEPGRAAGLPGRAWCPTPRALTRLRAAGAVVPVAPAFDVIRRVNHRAFCAALGATLPSARFVQNEREALEAVRAPSPSGAWLLKRAFGFAGRGHLRVAGGAPGSHEIAWIQASLRTGEGLQIEPLVRRQGDFALHGFIDRLDSVVLGEPTRQECDERGVYRGSVRAEAGDLGGVERAALFAAAMETARACREAGYFGPFGIDAFRWIDEADVLHMNPRCELNARYTMGWAIGMGDRRPDLDDARDAPRSISS